MVEVLLVVVLMVLNNISLLVLMVLVLVLIWITIYKDWFVMLVSIQKLKRKVEAVEEAALRRG